MSILITGGAGYIGSHAVHALTDAGLPCVVLDDLSVGNPALIPASVPFVRGDAGDRALVDSILRRHRVTAVMHFSGSTLVPESVERPLRYYENNTTVARTLLEAAVENRVRHFLFSSTAAVYGNPSRMPVSEDDATQPLSPYGRSKLATEWMLRDATAAHGIKHVILRYFNVAGGDPLMRTGLSTPGATHVIKVAVEVALGKRRCFEIFGTDYATPDGTCIRDFIHVSDLADAHVQALLHLRNGGESATLNCGYGHGYSVREVLDAVRLVSRRDFPVRVGKRRAGDIAVSIADNARIRRLLPWHPRFDDLRTIIAHALAWERQLAEAAAEPAPALAPGLDPAGVVAEAPVARAHETEPS
jgi:UDP-glucose 4-epimerase